VLSLDVKSLRRRDEMNHRFLTTVLAASALLALTVAVPAEAAVTRVWIAGKTL